MFFARRSVHVTKDLQSFLKDKELHRKLKISLVVNDPTLDVLRTQDLIEKLTNDDSFFETLVSLLKRTDLSEPAFYIKANISRQVWHSMLCGRLPKRDTLYKAILTLELSYVEATLLMNKAGYEMDWSSSRNLVIIFCLIHKVFNTFEIDNLLGTLKKDNQPLFSKE